MLAWRFGWWLINEPPAGRVSVRCSACGRWPGGRSGPRPVRRSPGGFRRSPRAGRYSAGAGATAAVRRWRARHRYGRRTADGASPARNSTDRSIARTAGATGPLRSKSSRPCRLCSTRAWLTWKRAVSSLIALNATSGRCSRLAAVVTATDSSRMNSSTTRTLSSADTSAATCGRLRKSVVTAAATSSSRASEWIAVTFSCGVTGSRPAAPPADSRRPWSTGPCRPAASRSQRTVPPHPRCSPGHGGPCTAPSSNCGDPSASGRPPTSWSSPWRPTARCRRWGGCSASQLSRFPRTRP